MNSNQYLSKINNFVIINSILSEFYSLINSFYKATGVPILINTSFNLNGEPIVMSPEHAIRTFYSCGLDTLVIGDYVINKKND
jgi:carbamoyltransferase